METILVIIIFEKRKNHYSFVGSCLVPSVFRHVRSTLKERINSHKVVAESRQISGQQEVGSRQRFHQSVAAFALSPI